MTDLTTKVRKAVQGEQKWALLYMMVEYTDGTYTGMSSCKPDPTKTIKGIWPEVHGFYDTEAEANTMKASKGRADAYFVQSMRNYAGSGI